MSTTFERMDLDAYGGAVRWPALTYIAALRAAYAEIDRLRANALEWVTVTGIGLAVDARSLPEIADGSYRSGLVVFSKSHAYEPNVTSAGYLQRGNYADHWHWHGISFMYEVRPGDRWAYIPEAPDQFVGVNKTIPEEQS